MTFRQHARDLTLVALIASLYGCSTPGTGIVEIAPGTYMHSKFGGAWTYSGSEVKAELFKDANTFCASKGKQVVPLNSVAQDAWYGQYASAEIQFRCQ